MERRTKLGVVIALLLTLLAGMALGGLAGGGVGYYLARQQGGAALTLPSLAQPIANVERQLGAQAPTAAPAPTTAPAPPVTAEESAVVTAVKQVSPAVVTVVNTLQPNAQLNETQRNPLPFPFPSPNQPQ